MRRPIAISLLACLALAACSGKRESTAENRESLTAAVLKWKVPSQAPFVHVALRSDGSALATTHDDVVAIDTAGHASVVHDGPPPPQGPRPVVSEGSDGFLLPGNGQVRVYDASGGAKTKIALGINEYAVFVPGSLRTFVPLAESSDPEHGRVVKARVLDESGKVASTFVAEDLVQSRVTASHVLWATRKDLTKTKLDGSKVWTLPIRAQKLEASADAGRLVVNRGGDTRVVQLYAETKLLGSHTFDAPIWNIAIAPAGRFAAANSKTTLRIFDNGKQRASIALGNVYPVSLDVADDGAVLLGLQDGKKPATRATLYDASGTSSWSQTFASDRNAYRPDVRFTPDGSGFAVRDAAGLSFFSREAK